MANPPKIYALSRAALAAKIGIDEPCLLIAIRDPGSDAPKTQLAPHERLDFEFDDVSYASDYDQVFSDVMAKTIAKSLTESRYSSIVVSCEFGVSRSAGVAAAIEEHYTKKEASFWYDSRFAPNVLVYRILLAALKNAEI